MARLRNMGRVAWLIVAAIVIDVLWLAAMGSALDSCQKELQRASDDLFGITFGSCSLNWSPFLVVNVLVVGAFVVWHVSRRSCPVCATKVPRGATVCRKCGFDFAHPVVVAPLPAHPAPTDLPPSPISAAPSVPRPVDEIEWLSRGERYLLGRTLVTPYYGIWDADAPGPPSHRYPYTEHGKSEAQARFAELEGSPA